MSFLRFLSFPQLAVAIALHLFATPGAVFFLFQCAHSLFEFHCKMMAWIRLSWSVLACLTYVNINAWKSSSRLNTYSRHGCNSISPVSCFARETWHIYNMAMFGWWFIIVRRTRRENLIVHRRDRQNGIRNVQWTWTTHTHTNRFWIRHSKYRDATHFALLSIWKKRNQLHRKVLPNEYSYSLVSSVNKVRDAGERCVAQISLETCKRRSRFHTSHLFNMTACLMANLWLFSETASDACDFMQTI